MYTSYQEKNSSRFPSVALCLSHTKQLFIFFAVACQQSNKHIKAVIFWLSASLCIVHVHDIFLVDNLLHDQLFQAGRMKPDYECSPDQLHGHVHNISIYKYIIMKSTRRKMIVLTRYNTYTFTVFFLLSSWMEVHVLLLPSRLWTTV